MNEFFLVAVFFTTLVAIFAFLSWREEGDKDNVSNAESEQSYSSDPVEASEAEVTVPSYEPRGGFYAMKDEAIGTIVIRGGKTKETSSD